MGELLRKRRGSIQHPYLLRSQQNYDVVVFLRVETCNGVHVQLIQQIKYTKSKNFVNVRNAILIGSNDNKRIDWPLGKIVEIIKGKDGIGRLARLKTSKGELLRPTQRLYPLEMAANETNNISKEEVENGFKISKPKTIFFMRSGRQVK